MRARNPLRQQRPRINLDAHPMIPECMFWPIPADDVHFSAWQADRCGGCGANGGALVLDHDHVTGLVRGYLCRRCNIQEGANDGPKWVRWRGGWNPATLLGDAETYRGWGTF